MAVECTINDLGLNGVSSSRENKQSQIVSEIKKDLKFLTAEKIYSLLKRADYPDWALSQWVAAFKSDDHVPWYIWVAELTIHDAGGKTNENGGTRAKFSEGKDMPRSIITPK